MAREGDTVGLPLFCHVSDMRGGQTQCGNGADALMHFAGVMLDIRDESGTGETGKFADLVLLGEAITEIR